MGEMRSIPTSMYMAELSKLHVSANMCTWSPEAVVHDDSVWSDRGQVVRGNRCYALDGRANVKQAAPVMGSVSPTRVIIVVAKAYPNMGMLWPPQ